MSDAPLTVGRLARQQGLCRSTLLYYDRLGLLRPTNRGASNYRLYSAADARRLERICQYRQMGLPLAEIRRILEAREDSLAAVLQRRLVALNGEIDRLREQQQIILRVLQAEPRGERSTPLDKAGWIALLRAAGLDEAGMRQWHREFERRHPDDHQAFLENLGIPATEIRAIRQWSRSDE
jgi:DNA-binding transcriptional MerR regulator